MCKLKSACSSEVCPCYVELPHAWQELGVCIAIASCGSVDNILSFHCGWSA